MPSLPSHEASLDAHLDRVCEHAREHGLEETPEQEAARIKIEELEFMIEQQMRVAENGDDWAEVARLESELVALRRPASRLDPSPLFESVFKTDDVIRALGAMVRLYDNPESATEEYAATAAREGRPAYWTTATYHNQTARLVVEHANRESLRYAIERFADDGSPVIARHTMALLNDLLPLNTLAIREIAEFRAAAQLNLILRVKRAFETQRAGIEAVGRAMDRIAS